MSVIRLDTTLIIILPAGSENHIYTICDTHYITYIYIAYLFYIFHNKLNIFIELFESFIISTIYSRSIYSYT